VSATVDAAALGPVPAPPAAFVAAVAAVVAADDSAGSIFLNASIFWAKPRNRVRRRFCHYVLYAAWTP